MRSIGSFLTLLLLTPAFALASGIDAKPVDSAVISALVAKANLAPPREQCFLYAEIVHDMTELAGNQLSAGEDASATLQSVKDYTEKIHLGLANDTKRLKNAQLLMEHTAFRLNEYMHSAALDDRPTVEAALQHLNEVQSELMLQVFRH